MKPAKILALAALCLGVCSAAWAAPVVKSFDIDEGNVKISVPQIKGAAGGKLVDAQINKALSYYALKQLYAALPAAERDESAMRSTFDKAFAGKNGTEEARDFVDDVAGFVSFKLYTDLEEARGLGSSVPGYDLHSNYTVHFNGDNILSVEQRGYIYTGGAHGNVLYNVANFDLNTGKELYLFNIFKNGTGYMARLNELVDKQEAQQKGRFYADVVVDDSDSFYFNENGELVITYAPYEVAPYAAGIINFTIPTEEIAAFLKVEVK